MRTLKANTPGKWGASSACAGQDDPTLLASQSPWLAQSGAAASPASRTLSETPEETRSDPQYSSNAPLAPTLQQKTTLPLRSTTQFLLN